jgi:fibronectin-binding autotransporter adhesin
MRGRQTRVNTSASVQAARRVAMLSAAVAAGLAARPARAANGADTWVGNASANWNDVNWSGTNDPPVSGDSLVFGVAGSAGANLNDNLTSTAFSVAGLTFNASASAFNISGNAFTLAGAITNSGANAQQVNDAIALAATENVNASSGGIALGGVVSGSAFGLNVLGANTVTLTNANTYTGTTSVGLAPALSGVVNGQVYAGTTLVSGVGGGTLKLDFSAAGTPPANIISTSSSLTMGDTALALVGAAAVSNSQTVNGLTLNPGLSTLTLTAGNNGSVVLNLGAITQDTAANNNLDDRVDGLNVNLPAGTQSTTNGVTTSNVNTNGIIKPTTGAGFSNITVNGTDFATNSTAAAGGNIIAYIGYDTSNAFTSPSVNYSVTGSSPTLATGGSANTVRFADTTGRAVTITSGTLTVSGGGAILMSANSGGITNTITGGTLTGLSNRGLEIFQYDTTSGANLQVNSAIGPNGANTSTANITLLGGGLVTFGGANFYNGVTSVDGGTLSVGSDQNLGGNNGTISVTSSSTGSATVTVAAVPAQSTGFAVGTQLLGQTVISISGTTVTLSGSANTAIGTSTSVGFASGSGIALNGGTLQATNSFSISEANATGVTAIDLRSIGLGVNGGTIDVTGSNTLTVPGVVGGTAGASAATGALSKTDSGTLAIAGSTANTNLFLNNQAGTTTLGKTVGSGVGNAATTVTVTGGTVQLTTGATGGQVTNLVVNGGIFDLNGFGGIQSSFTTLNGTGGTITNSSTTASAILYIGQGGAIYNDSLSVASTISNGATKTLAVNIQGSGTSPSTRTISFSGANTYSGGTTVGIGTLRANNTAAAGTSGTGLGDVIVSGTSTSFGTLGGSGTAGNTSTGAGAALGTGVVTINGYGTIAAGASNTSAGTLTTGAESWNSSSGRYLAKVFDASNTSTGTAGNDRLVMSGLNTNIPTGFAVDIATSNGSAPSLGAGTVLVLANDTDQNAGTNPFSGTNSATTLAALTLEVNGSMTNAAGLTLATQSDTLAVGGGDSGYDLVLEAGTAATPEPASLLLAGVAAAPLALGRRRRQRA